MDKVTVEFQFAIGDKVWKAQFATRGCEWTYNPVEHTVVERVYSQDGTPDTIGMSEWIDYGLEGGGEYLRQADIDEWGWPFDHIAYPTEEACQAAIDKDKDAPK